MGRVYQASGKIGPSDFLLILILSLWSASSTLYSFKLLALDRPDCRRADPSAFFTHQFEFYGLCFFSCANAMLGFLATTLTVDNAKPEAAIGWRMKALSYITPVTLSIAVFLSFLAVDRQARTCGSLVTLVHLLLVVYVGHELISSLRLHKICYGLFLGLLGGVVFTCYNGFGIQDPLLFQLMAYISVFMILLGGLYLFLRAKELSFSKLQAPEEALPFSKLQNPEDSIYC